MISRCTNPEATGYHRYGGRGIDVCDRWMKSFWNFLEDMGKRPPKHSLDRINNDLGYSKENCRWSTQEDQCNNTERNVFLEHDGTKATVSQWAKILGIKANTITCRLLRGWDAKSALGLAPPPPSKECKKVSGDYAYRGRLSPKQLDNMIESIDGGMSQSEWGRRNGIHGSQVSRAYRALKNGAKTK
jgi:hypothetical protein